VIEIEFDGAPLEPAALSALTRYVLDLDFLPNRNLDAHDDLADLTSESARRGALAFAKPRRGFGGESCASCHPPSTFFRDGQVHRLGTGSPPSPHAIDGGYETPTRLGLAESAPYFHDGRFRTLREVVEWFDRSFALGLPGQERDDLVAYLEAV
jgi:cytochrome c peroxidase